MYRLTHSLLEKWMRCTDPDTATDESFKSFLDALERKPTVKTPAMLAGIAFEARVNALVDGSLPMPTETPTTEDKVVRQIASTLYGAQLQVREEKPVQLEGLDILLVGVADALRAGILYDIKRVQRYEYGKYQFSTQHPMYFELFPEAARFTYLIFDGQYLYREDYRRGDFEPIETTAAAFLRYLDGAGLMETYKKHWAEA